MSETPNPHMILKILSGLQLGAEVALEPGEYTLGSGAEDDINLIDVSVNPGHARLRIDSNKIELRAEAGALTLADGEKLASGSDWREIQPLDTITAGTSRFAVALPSARWSTITEEDEVAQAPQAEPATRTKQAFNLLRPDRMLRLTPESARPFLIPGATALGLLIFAGWFAVTGRSVILGEAERRDLGAVRVALAQLPFGGAVEARQEADGAIYVSGYVETPAERRAIASAVEKADAQAHLRIAIRELLRNELDALIKAERVKVSYTLSPNGDVDLSGIILSPSVAERFVARVRDGVSGVKSVSTHIKTADALLEDIRSLAHVSQIDHRVIFRLQNDAVEANGVIPSGKIDAWVGFLQAFSRQFGEDIGLRSYVQLKQEGGNDPEQHTAPEAPIMIGGASGSTNMDRLGRGDFALGDIFAGGPTARDAASPAISNRVQGAAPAATPPEPGGERERAAGSNAEPHVDAAAATSETQVESAGVAFAGGRNPGEAGPATPEAGARPGLVGATKPVDGKGGSSPQSQEGALFSPLLPDAGEDRADDRCRPGSRLTVADIASTLSKLDEMAVGGNASLAALNAEEQRSLLEVALNPALVRRCLIRQPDGARLASRSPYLAETQRNPDYVQVIVRDLPAYDLHITGANLEGWRFVLTKDGSKFFEGASPDVASRIEIVGELGVAVRKGGGYARALYGRDVNWISRR